MILKVSSEQSDFTVLIVRVTCSVGWGVSEEWQRWTEAAITG